MKLAFYLPLILFVLSSGKNSSSAQDSSNGSIKDSSNEKVYTNPIETSGYSEEKPAYCYFKQMTIKRLGTDRLEFTVELQGDLPPKDERSLWYMFYIDIDKNPNTGTISPNYKIFGRDIRFWITRDSNERKFTASSGTVSAKNKDQEINVKKIDAEGSTISFVAQSDLFDIYSEFRFYAATALRKYSDKNKDEIENTISIGFLPKSGIAEY